METGSLLRSARVRLIADRDHYEAVVQSVLTAECSVWIATANLKELMVESPGWGGRRGRGSRFRSVLELLDGLASRGVELRLLHARLPSQPFRDAFDRHPQLVRGGLELRLCPRVHMKVVVIDGALLYLGSANWTGAGLGARDTDRRNFEFGVITDDAGMLDQVQGAFDAIWTGARCGTCKLRDLCEAPLDDPGGRGEG